MTFFCASARQKRQAFSCFPHVIVHSGTQLPNHCDFGRIVMVILQQLLTQIVNRGMVRIPV